MAIIKKKKKPKITESEKYQLIKQKLRQLSDEERENLFNKICNKIDNQTFIDDELTIFFALCSAEFM